MLIYNHFASLTFPKGMLIMSSFRVFGKTKTSFSFLPLSCVTKCCPTHPFLNFFLLFDVPPMPASPTAPIHTNLCASASILTFFAYPPKTSCPGKFPRPYGPKPCPVYLHMPMLTLFSCPPAPTYPIAPIRTHLYTVALVHTLNYNVYMYYLC